MIWALVLLCAFDTEKGIYSQIKGDEAYLVINLSSTEWFTDANRLVLETSVKGPPDVEGVEHRLVFAPSQVEKVSQGWIKLEVELDEIGASPTAEPSFWVKATSESGCFLGSHFVPFPHGH